MKRAMVIGSAILLSGCVSYQWAPPAGGSAVTYEQQSAWQAMGRT
jgi:PBP1b-binding outer membrane lipoprotein LpoB